MASTKTSARRPGAGTSGARARPKKKPSAAQPAPSGLGDATLFTLAQVKKRKDLSGLVAQDRSDPGWWLSRLAHEDLEAKALS